MNSKVNLTKGIKVFAGNSNLPLAKKVAKTLGIDLSDIIAGKFSDGESTVKINEMVRGFDVFIIQSTSEPVNDNLMELLIIIDALKRASAGRITAVMPYFGYSRQDMKYRPRDPISARLVADLLYVSGANIVLSMDIHTTQIQGFFSCPMDIMRGNPLFVDYYRKKIPKVEGDFVVVSPTVGAVKRNRALAESLNLPMAIIDNRLQEVESEKVSTVIGNVKGKNIIMVDDMINTATSMCNAADVVKASGANRIFACCSHPIFAEEAVAKIQASPIEELVLLDTINQEKYADIEGFKFLSICKIVANAIISVHNNKSMNRLYDNLM